MVDIISELENKNDELQDGLKVSKALVANLKVLSVQSKGNVLALKRILVSLKNNFKNTRAKNA